MMNVFYAFAVFTYRLGRAHRLRATCLALTGAFTTGLCAPSWALEPARQIESLAALSIDALRARTYQSELTVEAQLGAAGGANGYQAYFSSDQSPSYSSFVASYDSDGLKVYTRIDVPAGPPPADGYPVVLWVHGWVGRENAPSWDFAYQEASLYGRVIDSYVDAGFVVFSPGLRGHGSINGVPAQGIEFLDAWDNASYLSPAFYTVDVLNLLEGIEALEHRGWDAFEHAKPADLRLDMSRIYIEGHSQGGDVALMALAVSGEGSALQTPLAGGLLWSACFAPRFEQLEVYRPMARTLQAFMSGDGTWTGSAEGKDGRVNRDFVFAWPPDWIGTVDIGSAEWTWQADSWSVDSVEEVLRTSYSEMYRVLNEQVSDLTGVKFTIERDPQGQLVVVHDPGVSQGMERIGGYAVTEYLTEPLLLHHSDQDYYSLPRWNRALARKVNASGGNAWRFSYPANNHSLLVSEHEWFSPPGTGEGLETMLRRNIAFMNGKDPSVPDDLEKTSIEGLERFAKSYEPAFSVAYEREPLDDLQRQVIRFDVDGLAQHALVIQPAGLPPAAGWPVVVANHGYHSNPPDNGRRVADGVMDRPGDYYRGIPEDFARAGFLLIWPDYRGHGDSEGLAYTASPRRTAWYARDSIAAFRIAQSLPAANAQRMYLWGHSMGSTVTIWAALALGDAVAGASVWSIGAGDVLQHVNRLQAPLAIHHAARETVIQSEQARALSRALKAADKPHQLRLYDSDQHLLSDEDYESALAFDVDYFGGPAGE